MNSNSDLEFDIVTADRFPRPSQPHYLTHHHPYWASADVPGLLRRNLAVLGSAFAAFCQQPNQTQLEFATVAAPHHQSLFQHLPLTQYHHLRECVDVPGVGDAAFRRLVPSTKLELLPPSACLSTIPCEAVCSVASKRPECYPCWLLHLPV